MYDAFFFGGGGGGTVHLTIRFTVYVFFFCIFRTVGVLSAMFGVTNRLLDGANQAVKGNRTGVTKIRNELLDTHTRTVQSLCSPVLANEASDYIQQTLQIYYDNVVNELMEKKRLEPYDTDRISSVGERWSTRIMAAYMQNHGYDAPFVESNNLIVTDNESGNARPILEDTRKKTDTILVPMLERNAIPIVTGFFGASQEGKLTTLGRGGSDLTAAVLGYCLDAQEVSLYKVEYTTRPDGWMDRWASGWVGVVHDADPTTTIDKLSYEEARELAHFAKKVLHPETVSPAVEKAIPIAVRNTFDPLHPGTVIGAAHTSSNSGLLSSSSSSSSSFSTSSTLTSSKHTSTVSTSPVSLSSASVSHPYHQQHTHQSTHINGNHRPVEARVQTVTKVPLKAYEAKNSPLRDLDLSALHVKREETALVVLVGLQVMNVPDIERRVVDTLQSIGIPVYVPRHVNGSENNFSVIVPETRRNEAVDILHKRFVIDRIWDSSKTIPTTAAAGAATVSTVGNTSTKSNNKVSAVF